MHYIQQFIQRACLKGFFYAEIFFKTNTSWGVNFTVGLLGGIEKMELIRKNF